MPAAELAQTQAEQRHLWQSEEKTLLVPVRLYHTGNAPIKCSMLLQLYSQQRRVAGPRRVISVDGLTAVLLHATLHAQQDFLM